MVELLRNDPSSLAADTVVKTNTVPKLETPVSENADDQAMLRQVIEYYHQTLKQEVEAQARHALQILTDHVLVDKTGVPTSLFSSRIVRLLIICEHIGFVKGANNDLERPSCPRPAPHRGRALVGFPVHSARPRTLIA